MHRHALGMPIDTFHKHIFLVSLCEKISSAFQIYYLGYGCLLKMTANSII